MAIRLCASALILMALGGCYWGLPLLLRPLLRARFLRRIRQSGCVCLTFDDGPHPEATPQILALLEEAGVRATFFVLGCQAERYPDVVAQIARHGHELGEHGYGHRHAWKSGPLASLADVLRGRRCLAPFLSSARHVCFRPPYGKLNLVTLLYLWLGRRHIAFWDLDPRDYAQASPEPVLQYLAEWLEPGVVVLLHDGRQRPDSDPAVTVAALKRLLKAEPLRRLRFTTITEALSPPSAPRGKSVIENIDF